MGWEDGLAVLNSVSKSTSWTGWQQSQSRRVQRAVSATQSYDPFRAAPVQLRVPRASVGTLNPKYQPAEFPEKIEFSVPWSTTSAKPPPPQRDTRGDFFASLGASFENAIGDGGYLNLGNAVPWGMERMNVIAETVAGDLTGDDETAVSSANDFIGEAISAVSGYIAPVLEFIPNLIRDTHLNQRAMTYRALVTGQSIGPLETVVSNALSLVGLNLQDMTMKGQAAGQMNAQTRAIMAAAIDLPESVKRGIVADPEADVNKLFDQSAEGRAYSYKTGVEGAAINIGSNLIVYGSLIAFGFGAAGMAGSAAAGSSVPGLAAGGRALATGARMATNIQRAFLASGMTYFGLSTLTDAIARTAGDQAVVDWFDRVNRSTIISDDPAVQIVTGFTVDPFRSANLARKGTVALAKGAGNVTVAPLIGRRLTKLYTQDELIRDTVAKMFGTTRDAVEKYVGPEGAYDTWQEATDRVVELAWDHVATTLTDRQRTVLGAIVDGAERSRTVMAMYAGRIIDTIENHPEAIVARLRRDWEYRDAAGAWDADVAAIIERDYVTAKKMTAEARQRTDTVVGFVEYLNPEGQRLFAQEIDDLFASGRPATLRDLNTLNAKYPAIRSLYRDLVSGKVNPTDELERSVFDTVLARATDAYTSATKTNPVHVRTGVEPILRPGSVRRVDDMADALGTTPDLVLALDKIPDSWTPEQRDLVAMFAREKGILGDAELAAVTPDELLTKVTEWVDAKTEPWLKRGRVVEGTEADFARVSDRIKELDDAIAAARKNGEEDLIPALRSELNRAHAERGRYYNLLSDVREPEIPFTQSVRFARRTVADDALIERANAKVKALEIMEGVQRIDDEIDSWNTIGTPEVVSRRTVRQGAPSQAADDATRRMENMARPAEVRTTVRRLSPLDMVRRTRNGNWGWAGTAPPMSDSLYRKLAEFLHNYGGTKGQRTAAAMSEMGDEELWRLLAQNKDAVQFRRSLTGTQRRVVDNASRNVKSTLDEYKDAWARQREAGRAAGDEEFLDYLGDTKTAREELLAGKSEYVVKRTAQADIPQWAVDEAAAGGRPELHFDPEAVVSNEAVRRRLAVALDGGADTFPAVREIVSSDPMLYAQAERLAAERGVDTFTFLTDPANAPAPRSLVGELGEDIVPGVPRARTDLDQAILDGNNDALVALRGEMDQLRGRIAPPLRNVPRQAAEQIASKPRPSTELSAGMRDAGVGWHEPIPVDAWAKHGVGAKVASMILHGDTTHPPRTPQALLRVLKEIENGNAENIGIGVELAAEAQRAAKSILGKLVADARKAQIETGVLGMGRGLNPYTWAEDTFDVIADLFGKHGAKAGLIVRDDALGLQYGLKQRPKTAVVLEMSAVPGLAEELLTGHFQPFNERIFNAQVRQQFNHIFVGHHNQEIAFAARGRFIDSLAQKGIPADLASRIWRRWKERAVESRGISQEKIKGEYRFRPAGNALYASERNIPNAELNGLAHAEAEAYFKGAAGPEGMRGIDFAEEFRISTSFTRRQLAKLPMGDALQKMYGAVVHNKGVTTLYYMFRFGLDLRFHALNMLEGPALYAGRSGLRASSRLIDGDEGLFGMTRQAIESFAKDGLHDTGYPFSHSRAAWAYRTFLKEQPDALRGLLAEDPKLMQEAIEALAKYDPELSATIKAMGDTPDTYLKALDKHYRKIMESAEPEAVINKELMQQAVGDPVLAEMYGRLADVNAELWSSVRATFFGNPARSQVERALNHYLLYWPISYQIKATKWLARILFDRAGGLKTNAGGAVALDRLAQYHQELLETDPEYAEFFDENPTLVFVAQMMFPMTPGSIGVSLSPLTRDLFFGASKQITAVGPIYTATKLVPELMGELYRDFGQVPGVDPLYRALTGKKPPDEGQD
jgi:hypothetical protein